MARKHLTYLDIPPVRRRATASKTIARLKESMGNPILTTDQQAAIASKIEHLNKWASGTLPTTEHAVEVSESVSVSEDRE